MVSPVLFFLGKIAGVFIYLSNKGNMDPGSFSGCVTFAGENKDNSAIIVYCSVICNCYANA